MTDIDWSARLETLESRLLYQESAIEELTRSLMDQERLTREQGETIKRLEAQVNALTPSNQASPQEEPPPPHY